MRRNNFKQIILILFLCGAWLLGEDLSLYDSENPIPPPLSQPIEEDKAPEAKVIDQPTQNLSFKADVFSNDGYSEFELETGKAISNGVEAPMSRYGVGMNLNYLLQLGSRVRFDFFISNGLEINSQRRGGKIKSYDNAQQYENNAYDYGNKVMYTTWVNSISMIVSILETHNIVLAFKQTQLPIGNQPSYGFNEFQDINNFNSIVSAVFRDNPYLVMTQIFLTYSFIF